MANRKVLINRHTSGNTAPNAAEMYKGEIAIAHETGKETLFTKNNAGDMVPFISCAQTIAIIESKVQASDADVKAKEGEAHLEVATGETPYENHFTINTKDVQSEAEFEAYSAATKVRIDTNASAITDMVAVVSALTDVVVTGISGDTIIVAEPVPNGTGSNSYNLTHKQAPDAVALGFNKLATDAYGHVTAATAVATADIQALGFKTSAETGEDLEALSASVVTNKANIEALSAGTQHDIEALSGDVVEYVKVVSGNIETVINELSAGTLQLSADTHNAIDAAVKALDSETAVTAGKYMTGIAIADGKISGITEADLPTLTSAKTGDGNVVTEVTVNGHEVTYVLGATVATSEDLEALSASVISLSAATTAISENLNTLSGATEAISGYAHDEIAQLSGATEAISGYAASQIEALSAGTIQLSGDVVAYVNQLSGYAHGEIAELSGAVQANETGLNNLSAVTLTGVSLNNTPLAVADHVATVPVTTSGSGIASASDSGSLADAKAVKEYVQDILSSGVEYKGATDEEPDAPEKGDLWIASSAFTVDGKNVEVGDFIIYNGNSWDVIEKNLDGAITGTLTPGTVVLAETTNSVESLANGSNGQVLEMVNGAPAWANLPVLSSATTGTGNVVTSILVNDHEITYAKDFTAADNADLEAVSGIVDTFSAATVAEFNSAFTAINSLSSSTEAAIDQLSGFAHNSMIARDDAVFASAKTYVDEQIDEVYASGVSYTDAKVLAAIEALDSETAVTAGNYITGIAIKDGKISGITETALPANVAITATTGAAVDTPSAVLTGVTADGTDNHNLTFGMSNKVFSAQTSDSALTSESALTSLSAQTSVSANMAYEVFSSATITSGQVTDFVEGVQNIKVNSAYTAESADTAAQVANALSISGYASSESSALDTTINYDGSQAKSLTFGTDTAAGKSMSMTSAGLVDVEIIDCGEY